MDIHELRTQSSSRDDKRCKKNNDARRETIRSNEKKLKLKT